MANPPHKPTDEQRKSVKAMSAYGIPQDDISKAVGITAKTLRKAYRDELDLGHISANSAVVGALYKNALGGNVTAQIFWLKARMGWSDRGPAAETEGAEDFAKAVQGILGKMDDADGIG